MKEKVYVYTPPEPKEWIDLGSSAEIAEESTADTRPKVGACPLLLIFSKILYHVINIVALFRIK